MTPSAARLVEAARVLAWMPAANFGGRAGSSRRYRQRQEAADRLAAATIGVRLGADAPAELRAVLDCARRCAACSWSNRCGLPYAERRQAMAQLRGALAAWDLVLVTAGAG